MGARLATYDSVDQIMFESGILPYNAATAARAPRAAPTAPPSPRRPTPLLEAASSGVPRWVSTIPPCPDWAEESRAFANG